MATQVERRAATVARLLDAAEAVLHERGYAATSTSAVCERAGVSQGGLFRHFPTRCALLVATARRVAERQTADVPADLDLDAALRHLRDRVRSPSNVVWHELVHASRTDAELREGLAPALREYHRRTAAAVASLVPAGRPWTDEHQRALRLAVTYLDGEAAVSHVLPDPARDEDALQALSELIRPLFEETP